MEAGAQGGRSVILIVDGTGPDSDADYRVAMANSFCSQIFRATPDSTYWRGPTLSGRQVSAIADEVAAAAQARRQRSPTEPIILVAYSRGGCTVIIAARRLKALGIRVESMFLFDAVDMQTSELRLSQVISDNVRFVAHARSARDFGFWAHNPIASRWYFLNTGRWLSGTGVYRERSFTGTHGAVGGCPWAEVGGDAQCAAAVASWMNGQLVERNVLARLTA
jgi:hypothetical protein